MASIGWLSRHAGYIVKVVTGDGGDSGRGGGGGDGGTDYSFLCPCPLLLSTPTPNS